MLTDTDIRNIELATELSADMQGYIRQLENIVRGSGNITLLEQVILVRQSAGQVDHCLKEISESMRTSCDCDTDRGMHEFSCASLSVNMERDT